MKLFKKINSGKEGNETKNQENQKNLNTSFYSDKGRRENQEDAYLISPVTENQQLILVADGLGGYEYGEFASNQTIEIFSNFFIQNKNFDSPETFLRRTVLVAASMIMNKSIEDEKYKECATTLTGFMITGDKYYTINVGDSRSYKFSDNKLTRITKDHSLVQHLLDEGQITEEEAHTHPQKNIVTSIISASISELKSDVTGPNDLKKGDILIACSDGVHDYLLDETIEKLIAQNIDKQNLAEIIGKAAFNAESQDNITICIYKHI